MVQEIERKFVSISSKRQITIPQKFYVQLGFGDEAECILRGNELVLRPVKRESGSEFADLILEDLIKEGYEGNSLLEEFRKRQKQIRPAVEEMIEQADKAARGDAECYRYDDVFGEGE